MVLPEAREASRQYAATYSLDIAREEGKLIGQIRMVQKVLKQLLAPEEELQRITVEELTARLAELEKQAFPDANGDA